MPINMPGYKPAGIDGILKALQAVHSVYGINTESAQQKLLATQVEKAERENESEKSYNETGKLSPQQALKLGYVIQPGAQAPNPTAPESSAGAASPLRDAISQAGGAPAPQPPGTPLQSFAAGAKKQYGMAPITLGNGQVVQGQSLKIAQEEAGLDKTQLEMQHIGQQIGLAASEEKRKGEGQLLGIADKFNEYSSVKEAKDDISAAQAVNQALASGNKADIQLAKTKLPLLVLGIKRLGGEGESLADSKKLTDMLDEYVAMKSKGLPTGEAVQMLSDVASRVQKSSAQRLDDLATHSAAQAANVLGKDPGEIKNKLLLPVGTQTRKTKTGADSRYEAYLKRQGGGKNAPAE